MSFTNLNKVDQRKLVQLASTQSNPTQGGLSGRIQALLASRGIVASISDIVANLK